MFNAIISYLRARIILKYPRQKVLALRDKLLRKTLITAYDKSKFYRDLWTKAGIDREALWTVPLETLPMVNKKDLMNHFEDVITIPGITKTDIEDFIKSDPTGKKLYRNRYVAINTSGSSGFVGIFIFGMKFWTNLIGTALSRLVALPLTDFFTNNVRIAFIGEASGHHAGFSLVNDVPLLRTISVDVADPEEVLASSMNKFKPTVLVGYSSGLVAVAEAKIKGLLNFVPKVIITSGEPLSMDREQRIIEAFGIRPIDFYGATECLAMAASLHTSGALDVFDDIVYLEAVDDKGVPVQPGMPGRVVITIFGNDIFPLIRYTLDDEITTEPDTDEYSFTRVSQVTGRKLDRIKITLENGKIVQIHPMDLVGLFFPGLKQYQVVQTGPRTIILKMVIEVERAQAMKEVEKLTDLLLQEKGLKKDDIDLQLEFVDSIDPNPKTGKTPMIIPLKDPAANPASPMAS